ncbi:MAG: hypothetical protein ACLRZG_06955 [Streptococcus sp.]
MQIDHTLYLQFPLIVIFETVPETAIPDIPGSTLRRNRLVFSMYFSDFVFVIDILFFYDDNQLLLSGINRRVAWFGFPIVREISPFPSIVMTGSEYTVPGLFTVPLPAKVTAAALFK